MHERIRDAALRALGRSVASHPWLTLTVGLALAVVCSIWTVGSLAFQSDRSDLVDPSLAWNRRYARYKAVFPRWSDVTICLAGDVDDRNIDDLARAIANDLADTPQVLAADAGFEIGSAGVRLFRTADPPAFDRLLTELGQARSVAGAEHPGQALAVAAAALEEAEGGEDRLDRLAGVLAPYVAALRGEPPAFDWMRPERAVPASSWQPFVSESGRIRFVRVLMAGDESQDRVGGISHRVTWLRERVSEVVMTSPVPTVAWGVTGIPAIEADETIQSSRDATIASILALCLITVLMIAVFRGIAVPLLAAGSLLIGMAWSFGWLMVSVGHLQLLSVVFSVILLGLGIDFALHMVARLELIQDEHDDLPSAIARLFGGIGPGLLTGAVTTAAAFGAVAITQFKGMAEMGVIASGGILLCLIAMMTVFPAALAATGRWKRIIRHRHGGEEAHFGHGRLDFVDARPSLTLAVGGLVVAGFLLAVPLVRYDPNVLNLHPPGIESVRWEKQLVADDARSVWAALVRTSPEDAPVLADRLRALPVVSDVGGMGLFFPADRRERERRIAEVREAPADLPEAPEGLGPLRGQLSAVALGLSRRAGELSSEPRHQLDELVGRLNDALAGSARLTAAQQAARWAALDQAYGEAATELAAVVAEALAPRPLAPGDLPPALARQWVGIDGSWLVLAYPEAHPEGVSVLDPSRLAPFVEAVTGVAPEAMGPPVQIQRATELIQREYLKAAVYAVAAILIVLLLDFRSLADALCSMLPVGVGFLGVFGFMGIFAVPLNFANIIVLPIIFGIGVDAGVHMVHRWRAEPAGRPAGLSGGTGRGISLTMITTMIGFGCMLVAAHRGIRSLGVVMLAGLGLTLIACYTVLPALLQARGRRWSRRGGSAATTVSPPSFGRGPDPGKLGEVHRESG